MQKNHWPGKIAIGLISLFFFGLTLTPVLASSTQLTKIAVGTNPNGLRVNPVTNRIYVPNSNSSNVSVIEGSTNAVIATVTVGSTPIVAGVNPVTNRIYVVNEFSNTVSVIDGASNSVIATIASGNLPVDVGVNSATNKIYIANSASNSVSVINGMTNQIIETIPVGNAPGGLGFNPATNLLYVSNVADGTVSVIDTKNSNKLVATIAVGLSPNTIGVNSLTNRIYVPNQDSNTVSVIDGSLNKVVATIPVGTRPDGAGINPVTNRIYVPNFNTNNVFIIDGLTNKVIDTVAVGSSPADLGVNPTTGRIYVANYGSDNVSVLNDPVPPTITKAFAASSIALNGTTSLSFTLTNPNPLDDLSLLAFSDELTAGLQVAPAPKIENTCGGTLTAAASPKIISLANGTLAAGKSCKISVVVQGTSLGSKSNTTGPISARESGVGLPSNTVSLNVQAAAGPIAQLRFAHLAPVNSNLDIYVNRKLVLQNVAYSTVSPYLPYAPGNYAITMLKAGANINTTDPLIAEAVDLFDGEVYTYAALNFHDDPGLYAYFYRDLLKAPASGKAKIKVLHASPNAGAVDVAIVAGPVLARNLNNGESTEYIEVTAGSYNIEVREAGTSKVLYKVSALNLQVGSLYTVIAEGKLEGTPTFKIALIADTSYNS